MKPLSNEACCYFCKMSLTAFLYGGLVDVLGQVLTRYSSLGDSLGLHSYYVSHGPYESVLFGALGATALLFGYDVVFGADQRRASLLFLAGALLDAGLRYTRAASPSLDEYYNANRPWKTMLVMGTLASFMYWM